MLLDDLVLVIEEPYGCSLQGRARLYLRHSNADMRLTPLGRRVGLVSDKRWEAFAAGSNHGTGQGALGAKMRQGNKRVARVPQKRIEDFFDEAPELAGLPGEVLSELEVEAKYAGFIGRQNREVKRLERHLDQRLPGHLDWRQVKSLSRETVDKLVRYRPQTIGKALSVGVLLLMSW